MQAFPRSISSSWSIRRLTQFFSSSSDGQQASSEEGPSSCRTEFSFFFSKGLPLGLAALFNWGIPPLLAMAFAGHTQHSAHLQTSLGYGRVWYNCTSLMPVAGMFAYINNVIPGCIGAGRKDRIPRYLQRSVLLSLVSMIPLYVLQFYSGKIMEILGVPASNALEVGQYCQLMVITSVLTILDANLEAIFINLGYAKCSTLNSLISGIGVNVACTYFFIFQWSWGVQGAALAQMTTRFCRIVIWTTMALYYGLFRDLCGVRCCRGERLLTRRECWVFASLGWPQFISNLCGWLVFELQVMAIANIHGISQDALAAGAIWVQMETSLAAAQDGWIRTTAMRSLQLLGKQDPGARKAFELFNWLSGICVAITNVFLVIFRDELCEFISNDRAVHHWLRDIVWVLAAHTQTRILALNASFLFIPIGKGTLRVGITFVSFYLIALPFAGIVALTDLVTTQVASKLVACVGYTSIAQIVMALFIWSYLRRLDWDEAAMIIHRRANNDRSASKELGEGSNIEQGGSMELEPASANLDRNLIDENDQRAGG